MDEIDYKILDLLQHDAAISVADIADQVGLSPTPCWRRMQKLEQSGVITGRVALLNPDLVGAGFTVFVSVEAGDHSAAWLGRFADGVTAMPEVVGLHRMAGDIDYLVHVVVPDIAAFDAFYKRLIAIAPLKNVTSRFAMERLKSTTALPLNPSFFRDRRGFDDAPRG